MKKATRLFSGIKVILSIVCVISYLSIDLSFAEADPELPVEPKWITVYGVVTKNNVPIEGAKIWIGSSPPTITDFEGRYVIEVLYDLPLIRARTSSGVFIGEQKIYLQDDVEVFEIDFDFTPAEISGIVTENGKPAQGAKVFIGKNKWVVTDIQGKYSSLVLAGTIEVSTYTPNGEFIGKNRIEIVEGEKRLVNFDFSPATISGMITMDGLPIENSKIVIGSNAPVFSDHQGYYSGRVMSESVRVKVIYPDGRRINKALQDVAQGDLITLDFHR